MSKRSFTRVAAWGLVLFLLLLPLGFHFEGPGVKASLTPVAKIKADQRGDYPGQYGAAAVPAARDWIPRLRDSLLRFDFKQNLLVWPVLASGLIRSPPAA